MSSARLVVTALLTAALVAAVVLAVVASVWFVVPVPLLAAGCYAAASGMSPGRFADAVEDPRSGSGTTFPF